MTPPDTPSSRSPVIKAAIFGALSASVGFVALRFLMTPVRIKVLTSILSPTDYGMITLLSMSAHGMAVILSLGGLEYMLRVLPRANDAERLTMLRKVFKVSAIPFVLVAVYILAGWAPDSWYGGAEDTLSPASVALLFLLFLHVQQRIYFLLGCRSHVKARLTQLFWSDMWFIPLLLLAPWIEWQGPSVVWAWSGWIGLVIVATAGWVPVWKQSDHRGGDATVRAILRIGLPALPVILGEWTFRLFGHYLLLAHTDFATMALYALAVNVAMVGYVAGVPLIDMFSGELNAIDHDGPQAQSQSAHVISRCTRYMIAVALPVALALLFVGDDVLKLLAGKAFWDAASLLPWLAPVPLLMLLNLLLSRILVAFDRSFIVAAGAVISALVAVGFSLYWIPAQGALGAIWGMQAGVGSGVVLMLGATRVWRYFDSAELSWQSVMAGAVLLTAAFWGVSVVSLPGWAALVIAGGLCVCVMLGLKWVRLSDFSN